MDYEAYTERIQTGSAKRPKQQIGYVLGNGMPMSDREEMERKTIEDHAEVIECGCDGKRKYDAGEDRGQRSEVSGLRGEEEGEGETVGSRARQG